MFLEMEKQFFLFCFTFIMSIIASAISGLLGGAAKVASVLRLGSGSSFIVRLCVASGRSFVGSMIMFC